MKLTFIYNANSGKVNAWMDIGHKLISPETYSCNLCAMTHGIFAEREEWKQYRSNSQTEMEFLHKDEFEKQYPEKNMFTYPIILKSEQDGDFEIFMNTEEVDKIRDLEELIEKLP